MGYRQQREHLNKLRHNAGTSFPNMLSMSLFYTVGQVNTSEAIFNKTLNIKLSFININSKVKTNENNMSKSYAKTLTFKTYKCNI